NQFRTNIKNVAAEKGFYDLEVDDGVLTLEPGLAHLEANASAVIKKILKEKTLKVLDEREVTILAVFLAVQFVRTKEHRLRFERLGEMFAQKLREMGASEENIAEQTKSSTGLPEDKLIGFKSVLGAKEFVPHFLNKVWVLFETTSRYPFYISDNPLTLHNGMDHGFYGNIGLAVRGIELYLPISTTLCLALICPSIVEEFQIAYQNIRRLDQIAPGLADTVMKKPAATREFCDGLVNGTPISVIDDNVMMMNSLQVMYSSRFVYCERESFDLVERMIKDDERFREGLKPTVK
ncbi:MAG: DUF4238 domain-containing protein, partial [Candidatus Thiodiazotropha taylori]|nr:DUF4238 domain-containing protein [Candidatus Thiodiazotropha endolucinida]MCW4228217.1 DUF4238 domain-containing protein [Candidatus Thiodiazotropha taylori]